MGTPHCSGSIGRSIDIWGTPHCSGSIGMSMIYGDSTLLRFYRDEYDIWGTPHCSGSIGMSMIYGGLHTAQVL